MVDKSKDDIEATKSSKAFKYYKTEPEAVIRHDIYLTDEVIESKNYFDILNLLDTATSSDCFFFHLNSFGGYLHTAIQFINSLRNSEAGHIQMIVEAPVYSAASLIALCVEDVVVCDNTFLMFHTYSGLNMGKGHEQEAAIKAEQFHITNTYRDILLGFLTKKEINDIRKGMDIYVHAEEARKRLEKRNKKQ